MYERATPDTLTSHECCYENHIMIESRCHTAQRAVLQGLHALVIAITCASCATQPDADNEPVPKAVSTNEQTSAAVFDTLVTREFIAEHWRPKPALNFDVPSVLTPPIIKRYAAELQFERVDVAHHYVVDIVVVPAGHFLNADAYRQRKDADIQRDPAASADYPDIGLRARREFFGAGPGGSVYGLTFTTTDSGFDVRISVSNLLPEGFTATQFDIDGFARQLSTRYAAQK
jgi:hypothetical protein